MLVKATKAETEKNRQVFVPRVGICFLVRNKIAGERQFGPLGGEGEETEQTKLVLKYFRQTNKDLFSVILQRNPWRSNIVCQQKKKFKGFYVISDL